MSIVAIATRNSEEKSEFSSFVLHEKDEDYVFVESTT